MPVCLTPTRQPFYTGRFRAAPSHPQTALLGVRGKGQGAPEAQTQGTTLRGAQSGAGTRQAGRPTGCLDSPGVPAPARAHVPASSRTRYRFLYRPGTGSHSIPLRRKHPWTMDDDGREYPSLGKTAGASQTSGSKRGTTRQKPCTTRHGGWRVVRLLVCKGEI